MNVAVVDDERIIREQVCGLIEKQRPDCQIDLFATGGELLASGKCFDVVFLDIQMDGMNGIETARQFRRQGEETILVFITGIKEYVFEAFDVSAFHYLLKPIEEHKFAEVFDRAAAEGGKRKGMKERKIYIRSKNCGFTVSLTDILYIESQAKKVVIHTTGTEGSIEAYATMEELKGELGESFYRCHRGYLVNMAHITGYGSDSISLTDGSKVYLAKKKHSEFVKVYMWYIQNGGVSCV